MKIAALDLGTNSFLCLIAEVRDGRIVSVVEDLVEVVRLGQDVQQNKKFHPEALTRARLCLERFAQVIERHQPERVLAMATSAARDASNAEALFAIGAKLNIPIEVIPGGREAEITFQGATAHLQADHKTRLVVDVGGGSTEYIVGRDHKVIYGKSLNVGCVRLTERLVSKQPTSASEIYRVKNFVAQEFSQIRSQLLQFRIDEVIAVAGTPTSIAALELGGFDPIQVDGYVLSQASLQTWEDKFATMSVQQKISELRLEKGRADVILVGTIILVESLKMLGLSKLTVSTKGVRYGVALEVASRP